LSTGEPTHHPSATKGAWGSENGKSTPQHVRLHISMLPIPNSRVRRDEQQGSGAGVGAGVGDGVGAGVGVGVGAGGVGAGVGDRVGAGAVGAGMGGRFGDAQTSQLESQPAISFAERPAWKKKQADGLLLSMGVKLKALFPMLVTELPMAAEVRLEHE